MKKMKNIILYALCAGLAVPGLSGCDEDSLSPSYEYRLDTFMPEPGAQDSASILRRDFLERTGCYLLFNDTLTNEFLGYDYNGEPVYSTELLDIAYNLGVSTGSRAMYQYTPLHNWDEQKRAVDFLEDYVLVHLRESMCPFSFLLAYDIVGELPGASDLTNPDAVSGQRCVAIACDYLLRGIAPPEEYATRVLNVFVGSFVSTHSEEFSNFRAVSEGYYGGTFSSSGSADNSRKLWEAGFLVRGEGSLGQEDGRYPLFDADLSSYATYVLSLDEATMEAAFGQYPLVMQKYRLFRQTLIDLGYIF